ncbi:MAG: hypothetical protein FWD34_05675 [Oscillospiraceae bacterium]|nr:hypothetical protein [Oscillospiraceae bacterium]
MFENMNEFDKNLYKDTFSVLKASDKTLLEVMKMENKKKRIWQFTPVRVLAASVAAVMVLTIGVGALNDWNFSNVFGGVFGSGNSDFELPHTIKPEVTNKVNPLKKVDLEVLGIAGDDRALYMVVEFKGITDINDYELGLFDFTAFTAGQSRFGLAPLGTEESKQNAQREDAEFISYSVSKNILSESNNSIIIAYGYEFMNLVLEKGYMHFMLVDERTMTGNDNNQNYEESLAKVMTFDVLLNYDFSAVRSFEINQITNLAHRDGEITFPVMLNSVEITPIAVRFTINCEELWDEYGFNHQAYDFDYSVWIKLKNDETMFSGSDSIGGGGYGLFGGDMNYAVHFDTPYDLNDVYSVTIGDVEIVL